MTSNDNTATPAEFARILTEHKVTQGLRDPEQSPITRQYVNKLITNKKIVFIKDGKKTRVNVQESLDMLDECCNPVKAFSNQGKGGGRPPIKSSPKRNKITSVKPTPKEPPPAHDNTGDNTGFKASKSHFERSNKAKADKLEAEAALKLHELELKKKETVKFVEYNADILAVLYPMFKLISETVLNLGTTISVKFPYPEHRIELKTLIDDETRIIMNGISDTCIEDLIGGI